MAAPVYVTPEIIDQLGVIPEATGNYDFLPCEAGERWISLL
jgi:hypothetical protein